MSNTETTSNIPARLVKLLREMTGAGYNDCRQALIESKGDKDNALDYLRRRGQARAQSKAEREATDGLVGAYIHAGGKIGVLLEVNCETDFVARTEQFQKLCHDLAMHVAALDPQYVRREDVPREIVERELEIGRDQARQAQKPEPVIDKIASGKLEKFYEDHCLYEQRFIKDESLQVKELVEQSMAKLGEKISVRRFVYMKVGNATATYAAGSAPTKPGAPDAAAGPAAVEPSASPRPAAPPSAEEAKEKE